MAAGQANQVFAIFDNVEFAGARRRYHFLEETQLDIDGLEHRVDTADGLGVEGVT
ncbi:hypothetical protein D3C80_1896160 [compost metagenome]